MKPLTIFFLLVLSIALILFLFPINLFDGEIVIQNGMQEITDKAPLSLSYFIGMGYDETDMIDVKSFHLLPTGYLMAGVFILGLPGLIAYRIYLSRTKNTEA